MNFFDIINDAVGSRTIGACLRLCGYRSPSDFQNFDVETVKDIEKYVSNVCCTLKREKRLQYIDVVFADNPSLFTISPVIKSKLINFVQQATSFGQICDMMGVINPSDSAHNLSISNIFEFNEDEENIKLKRRSLSVEEIFDESVSNVNETGSCNESKLLDITAPPNSTLCSKEVHQFVSDTESKKFENCQLSIEKDFLLYQDNNNKESGHFLCKLQSASKSHTIKFRIVFNKEGKPNLSGIHNHIRSHFEGKSKMSDSFGNIASKDHALLEINVNSNKKRKSVYNNKDIFKKQKKRN